jgi:hypothetical protein
MLHDRLRAEQWFARHPEILARPLPHPVIVVGPMRSGTTRMHRLLAADHRFTHMRSFETISPVPRPEFVPAARFPRHARRRGSRASRGRQPAHADDPSDRAARAEEELGLLVHSFWSTKHDAQWWVPSYARWCEQQDPTPAYRQMARLLQLIGWSQQASSLRPWVLKTPQHMLDLPVLMATFPDARLIFTHRDPLAVVGSAASLAWNQTVIYSDHADPAASARMAAQDAAADRADARGAARHPARAADRHPLRGDGARLARARWRGSTASSGSSSSPRCRRWRPTSSAPRRSSGARTNTASRNSA